MNDIKIAEMRITPIAIADPPIRSSYGLHQPYALRTIVSLSVQMVLSASVRLMVVKNRLKLLKPFATRLLAATLIV